MATSHSVISDMIQKNVESNEELNIRTFTKWINSKLSARAPKVVVKHLIKDIQDGRVLLSLLEVLLKIKLRAEKGKLKFHKINNVNTALKALEERGLKLHGISSEAIVDGNKTSILGLIWIIILHFQVQGLVFEEEESEEASSDPSPRKKSVVSQGEVEKLLIKWAQEMLKGFTDVVEITDILKSWQNGLGFLFLLFVFRPEAVDIEKGQKMSVHDRLDYAFTVADEEFDVHGLLEPTDVEQGKVDKKAMLMYLSALYEVLGKLEPAVIETTSTVVSEEPVDEGIGKTTTSFEESAPGAATLRIGDEEIEIKTVSSNDIVLKYKMLYYEILYTIKELEARIEKIRAEEPSQENAIALRNIQNEMRDLQEKIKTVNDTNKEMAKAEGVDRQEFSDIQTELADLSRRWSTLIQHNNEETKRQPAIIREVRTTRVVQSTRLTIGDEVIEITTISTNEIVLKYKMVYYQIIIIVKRIEANMKIISEEAPSQETARLLDENKQRMEQLQPKIVEMNELMAQMKDAEDGVDANELAELESELSDFNLRMGSLREDIKTEEKRQPEPETEIVYKTMYKKTVVENAPSATLRIGDEVIEITTVSSNEIVLKYKMLYYEILYRIAALENRMEKIRAGEPSQENAIELRELQKDMQEVKIKELNDTNKRMEKADGVDRQEFSDIQSDLRQLSSRWSTLIRQCKEERERQPRIVVRPAGQVVRLTIGEELIEFTVVSTNKIVITYRTVYYQIITIIKLIESNMKIIHDQEPSEETAKLLDENKQRMEQLQPKITEMNELMAQMKDAEGVDAKELAELESELSDFNLRMGSLREDINAEEKRQPELTTRYVYTYTTVERAPSRRHTIKFGDQVIEITTISTNEIVIRYKILYYEIITLIRTLEVNMAQIKEAPPSETTAIMLKQNKEQMEEIQAKIRELQGMRGEMEGADGVDPQEFSELQADLDTLDSQWTTVTTDIESEDQRISIELDSSDKQKASLDEWRKKCEAIGDWMDSVEDNVEILETRKPSTDLTRAKQQMEECDTVQEKINSDEVPASIFSFGEATASGPSLSPEQQSKIRKQIAEMKKEIGKLSDRAGDAKHRYKLAVGKLEAEKKQQLVDLKKTYEELDKQIDILKEKDDQIGNVEGDPATVRAKETSIELLVSDIQVFQPRFDQFRHTSWEVMEGPTTDQSDREALREEVTSLEERWGLLIRSVYSRSETAKSLITKLPQGGVLEELIIVENQRHDYNIDWRTHQDLFATPDGHDEDSAQDVVYRERLMTKWKRECRELDGALSDVERENSELGEILEDPTKVAMQRAKLEVIQNGLRKVEKEYNDLPEYANLLLDDPKLSQEDREKIQSDLDSYRIRYVGLLEDVSEKDDAIKKKQAPKSTVVVTESFVPEKIKEIPAEIIVPQSAFVEESELPEPELPGNAEEVGKWWDDDREVVNWIEKTAEQVKQADSEPATTDLVTTRKQHAHIERITREIGAYESNVTILEKKGNAIVEDPVTGSEDRESVEDEIKTVKRNWDSLKENAFKVERNLYEQVNKLQEYLSWTQKSEALAGWLEDTERSLDSCATPSSNPVEREKQTLFLEKFLKERGQNQESVDDVLSHGNLVVNKNLIPEQHHEKISNDLKDYREKWNDLLTKAEQVQERQNASKKDIQKLEENQKEYEVTITWIISREKRLQELKDDTSGGDEALKQRRLIIVEIIEEITTYKIRLRRLIEGNEDLEKKDTVPVEDRDKLVKDTKDLETRMDNIHDDAKSEESRINDELDSNTAKLDDWQKRADDLDKWFITTRTEITSFKIPPSDEAEKQRQEKYLEDFANQKPAADERIDDIVNSGRQLVREGVIAPDKREKFEFDVENIPGTWDSIMTIADNSRENLDKAGKTSEDYDDWCKDAAEAKEMLESKKQEVETASQPASDPEARQIQITTITTIIDEGPKHEERVKQTISRGKELEDNEYLTPEQKEHVTRELKEIDENWDEFSDQLYDAKTRMDENQKNLERYEIWQQRCDDVKKKLEETKDHFDEFDVPTSDVEERQKQKRFLNDFHKKKASQEKQINDVVRDGQKIVDENIVPSEKREKVELDLQTLPESWGNLVARADENKKTVDSSLQDAVQLNKWRNDYNVVFLWIEKAEEKPKQREEDSDDLDKLKKERKKLETDLKDIVKYEPKILPLLSKGETISQSNFITPDDAKSVEDDAKSLKEKFEKLKADETSRKQKLDEKIQWLTEYKQYRTEVDALNVMIVDHQKKLETCEKPTSNKAERDKQASFLNKFTKDQPANEKRVDAVVELGSRLADAPGMLEDKGDEIKEEIKTIGDTWRIIALKVEELQKIVSSGLQNITELSDWRKEYTTVIKWIETHEKKLAAQGEPGRQLKNLSSKCTTLDEMVNLLQTYETRVTILLEKGDQLAKEASIDESDRKQTEDDTNALRERWEKLKADERDTKKRFDDQKRNVEDYKEWRENVDELKPWLDETKKELDACELPTSDNAVREKQANFIQLFADDKEKNQARVDSVVDGGERLLKENPIAQNDEKNIKDTMEDCQNSWNTILQRFDGVEESVTSGAQDIIKMEEWRNDRIELNKSLDNARQQVRNLKKPSKDPAKMKKQKEDFEVLSNEMDGNQDRINDLSQRAEYLITVSSISGKDKDRTSQDLEQLNNTWKNYKNEEETVRTTLDALPVPEPIQEVFEVQKATEIVVETSFQDIDDLFEPEPQPELQPEPEPEPAETVDFGEWKASVGELERILDEEDGKFDPKSNIEKEFSNLEKLAQETKESGATIDDVCQPKLGVILSNSNALINSKQLDPADEAEVTDKMTSLKDKTQRVDTAVRIVRMKVRDAALEYFNEDLNECSVSVIKMQETVKTLRPPANDLPGVRVQLASMKSLEKRISVDGAKVDDIEEKVNKMEDAGVLPQDGFAGTLKDRCNEVRKEQENVHVSVEEAKPKLHRALLNQLYRTQKTVNKWLKVCEKKERNIDASNVKDLDKAYQECLKLKQAKTEFDKGEPGYITLLEVHKEAVDDGILVDKKAADFEKQLEGITSRHDGLKKRLEDKENELHSYVRQSTQDVLNSAEEKLEEQKTWLAPEDPADNFPDAKEQQDTMKERELIITERRKDVIKELGPVEKIATGEILPLPESTTLQRRITDAKDKFNTDIPAAKEKSEKIQEGYGELLKKEIEKRKAWLDDHKDYVPEADTDFKDFNEFKVKYDQNKDFVKELDDNNILVLLEEAEKIDGIEPEVKDELKDLNERWEKIHDANKDKTDTHNDLMTKWSTFREQQLTLLNWIDEKDTEVAGTKDQVNLADEEEVAEQIKLLKDVREDTVVQGDSQEKKLKEAGEDLIRHLGENSPAAAEIQKQMEDVDSCRKDFVKDIGDRIEKIESGEQKTRDLYNDMDDVTTWLDTTGELIDTYENHEKQAGEGVPRDEGVQAKPPEGAVEEEMVHVVEEILVKRKEIPERELQLNNAVVCIESLDGQLDETATGNAVVKVNDMKDRWNVVTQRLDEFCSRDIPEIEIAEIKAEHLEDEAEDEIDLSSVVTMDTWREKVRKVSLLLKYVERLVGVTADAKVDYPSIRILASNTKEATKSLGSYCKPRMAVITALGDNIVNNEPDNVDQKEEITTTVDTLNKRIEVSENSASILKMKVRDLALDYFNNRFNNCEIVLESEEENVNKLTTAKPDLATTQEQMVLLKEGRKEFDKNQEDFDDAVLELKDKKISEFLLKEGFQGTLVDKSDSIKKRRDAVDKKLSECETRIRRNLVSHLTEMKKAVAKWLSSCEKKEKAISVEPAPSHDPVTEYRKLKDLREEMDAGEPKYDATMQLNKQLVADKVLEGRKVASSEKDLQSFAGRFAALGKRFHDKNNSLYTILLNVATTTMDEVRDDLKENDERVDQTVLSEKFPQVKQDFQNAKKVKEDVDDVCEKSTRSLKDIHIIIALDVFKDDDRQRLDDRRNELKDENSKLSEKSEEKFDKFAKQYNEIIENEVKNRKMWLDENESWMAITDHDVDDLPGFVKKLEEQKIFQEELERRKMEGLIDEARENEDLASESRILIYELDDKWNTINSWSEERMEKLDKINTDWKHLRVQENELLDKIDKNDAKLKQVSAPVDLSDEKETENQRNDLKNLQADSQELVLAVEKIKKSSRELLKLVGPDSLAGKRMQKEVDDVSRCHDNLCTDTLTRLKKLDASERKTKALYDHMDEINTSMDESENILKSLNEEMKQSEEKKDTEKEDEVNENEEKKQDEAIEEKEKPTVDLNKFVDQVSLRLGERPEEKARVQRAKELEHSLEEDLDDEARNILQKQVEDFDYRWNDVSEKMDGVVKDGRTTEEKTPAIKAIQVEEVEAALPEDQTVDYDLWKGDAAAIDEAMLKSQTVLQADDVDVNDYSSVKKAETETQDIIHQLNTEFKPKLMTLRTSGEKIPEQDSSIPEGQVDDIVNSSQKNLEGLQSALELRKFRLRDTAVQHMNDRILDCEANVGEEQVKLQLFSPPGKDLDTVLDQLEALQESEKTFQTNQVKFEEVQVQLNELKQSKILTSPEFQEYFQDDCRQIAVDRAQILKQTKEHKNKLYRSIVQIFEVRRKEITKWLKNCEKKEKEIPSEVKDLDDALIALKKLKEAEDVLEEGERNYYETVDLGKTVSENEILVDKKAKDAENDMKNSELRYNQALEDVQNKKNKLYNTIHEMLTQRLDETEGEIKKGEDIVQSESKPDDPTATHEKLSNLQGVVNTSDQLREDSEKLFDKANVLLLTDIFPADDKKELRIRVIDLDKRAYLLPDAAKDKYEQVYSVYLTHLTKLIQLRVEWITDGEPRMEETDTTDASDIADLESKLGEHEEFQIDLGKNNIRSVLDQIRDKNEVDPEVPLADLLSLEERWEVLHVWSEKRHIFLQQTLEKWQAFRLEEKALVEWIDKKDGELEELDTPVNLADENAVQERLETLKNLQTDVVQHSPNLDHFKNSGKALLEDLKPASEGAEQVTKQIEDFENCWKKLENDIENKIEKMEKSNRTIKAIYSYMDVVNSWLEDTETKLNDVDTTKDKLRRVSISPLSFEEHGVDGSPKKESGDEKKEDDGVEERTGDESDDTRGPKRLSEDEKEQLRATIVQMKDDIKAGVVEKELNKARIERAQLLVHDIQDDVDEDGTNSIEESIKETGLRYEQIDTRLDIILQEERPQELSESVNELELVTIETQAITDVQSAPPDQLPDEGTPEDTTGDIGMNRTPVEPYSGKVTLDLKEWRTVVVKLRDFLNRMQMNIRDVDSKNYVEMRECEVDTKVCIDAMEIYGKPCLNDLLVSGNGMLQSPEYTEDEKNEIRATLESLTVGVQFVNFNARDQRLRLYRGLISYQSDQRKLVQRWLNSCTKEAKEINEEVAGLEASDVEYKKVQHLKVTLASGEPTFLHFTELSKRMIQNNVLAGKKVTDTEKDIDNFTSTHDSLRADTERKDKRLYTTVVKSISLPLESIELAVTEAEDWVKPEELSSDYDEAKKQLNKMKLSVFVIETLHTRSAKVLKETEGLVSEHEYLTPEDKQVIVERVHALTPRTDGLPAAAVNKYKRMNREFLVLIESEVESREAWMTKNEARMSLPPAGDVKDIEGFLKLKDAHDDFLEELKRNEMSEFVKDSENMGDLKRETFKKILALQTRWSALLAWATERTVYLNTVIAHWQEFRQHEVTATDFIDGKEKDLQGIHDEAKPGSDEITTEKVEQLESMQAENRENSLEIWKLQRQSTVLMKSLGEDAAASESIEQETKDLVERNNKLSADISVEINELEANQYKAKKLQEHLNSVNDWTGSTTKFVDEFNAIAVHLAPADADTKTTEEGGKEADEKDVALGDEAEDGEKKDEEREEKVKEANEMIEKIAIRRVDIGEYKATVDRINELHAELPDQSKSPELNVQVEELNTNWKIFTTAVDKVAWTKIPGVNSLQAVTYILHDMKVQKPEEGVVASVETVDEWKTRVSELEKSVGEVEVKFEPKKDMSKDYGEIQAVYGNIQDCQKTIDEEILPVLEVIRLAGVKLCSTSGAPEEGEEEEGARPVPEEIKSEVTTTVLSLHEKIESVQTVIQLQRLRLEDVIHGYIHERVHCDKRNLAQERAENKRLFPVGEDVDTIIMQLEIIKETEKTFEANDATFGETRKQFSELLELQLIDDQELIKFVSENNKNLEIQRKTMVKLMTDIEQKLRRNLLSKFNNSKNSFHKWVKNMEKREKGVDANVDGVERSFVECTKLETIEADLPAGEEIDKVLVKLVVQINIELILGEAELDTAIADVNSLHDRNTLLEKNIEDKRNTLQTKIQEGLEQTLAIAEKSISDAEAWNEPSTLSDELEQATAQIQQSMENVTNVNNMYTQTMQSLKRPQEIAQSGILPDEVSTNIDSRCRDLTKRVGRLPAVVLKTHKSLFEAFTLLLHNVVNEREEWIAQNESNVMVSYVAVASLEDLKIKIEKNKEFIVEIKKHDMEPVIIEIEKMSETDFKLKATSKDLQSRLIAIQRAAEERQLVLLSILNQWESMREKLKELVDWIDMKDLKLQELKEQVNLADEDEVKEELKELKEMQTAMEDEYPEVVNFKKMGEGLQKILGEDTEASAHVDKQVADFMSCWIDLANDIQAKIRKLESSERQLSTMHRYMDNTRDWMDDINDLLDQHQANERRLQGLPVETEPKESEEEPKEAKEETTEVDGEPKVSEEKTEEAEDESKEAEEETTEVDGEKVSEEKTEVPEVEAAVKELDEDEKEKLREENKNVLEAFVIKRQSLATCQAFVGWAGELENQVAEDLDDDSKNLLKMRVEKFNAEWGVFNEKVEEFSQTNAEDIKLIEFQLAEQQSEDLPESVTLEEWKTDVGSMDKWFDATDEKCSHVNISRDSNSLKKSEQETKTILTEFNNEGKPRFNKIIVLGRRLIDGKAQSPEEEQEVTITITKFTKRMIEVERTVELQRIRTLETIVDYCKERLDNCEYTVERDEINMNQLTPSGATPDAVHEQIVLLKVCEGEIPQHEEDFVEIQTYITETRHPGFISYETQTELEKNCNVIEKRRNEVDKQLKESHGRLYRTMVNFFDQRKKVTLKWLSSCEKKERQVKPDVKELKDSKNEYIKVKEVRKEFDDGRPNFVTFVEIHKLVVADDVMDGKRSGEAERDVNSISGRVEQVDKILHEQETKLYTTLLSTLTVLLDSIETSLSDARGRIKTDEVISTYFKTAKKQMEDTKTMARETHVIHFAANKQLEQGDDVKRAKLLGPEDADTVELRLSDLTKKSADLQQAASDKERRMRVEYVTTFETELQKCSQWITFLELRVEKTSVEAEDYNGYKQLNEDHIYFEEDLKVYDLNMLVKEVDKIEDLGASVKQELAALEKRWKTLLKWSEERGQRLPKIVSLWVKFREEEIAILNWIDAKDGQLKAADDVNLADEEDVKEQLDVMKSLGPEREEYVKRSTDIESLGHELKRIVGDNTKAGESIQKQLVDLDQVFNELIKGIVQTIVKLESAQQRLQSMAEEMNVVNTWCNETEVLLDEFDAKEQKLQDLNVGKSDAPQEPSEEVKQETKREKRARIQDEKANLREEMIETVERLVVKFEKLSINEAKVKRVNTMGDELKEEISDSAKEELDNQLQPFNERFNSVSNRLREMEHKDLPDMSGCWFARFVRRKMFRASID